MPEEMEILERGAREIGISLSEEKKEKFLKYEGLIEVWNKRMNLVRIREKSELYRSHFLDSLWCKKGIDLGEDECIIDIGSGAGFPGIPLKICFPEINMVLLESQGKRCSFLREVIEQLELDRCRVIQRRAEDLAREDEYRGYFDAAVARALSELPVILELGLPLIKVGAKLLALKGRSVDEEIKSSLYACGVLGGRMWKKIAYSLHEEDLRNLVIYEKVAVTPKKYPRRPGIPQKRPLIPVKEKGIIQRK